MFWSAAANRKLRPTWRWSKSLSICVQIMSRIQNLQKQPSKYSVCCKLQGPNYIFSTDFIELLEHISFLCEACIGDTTLAMRSMRLVSKEASRVALLALTSYHVTLEGGIMDTHVNRASLLQNTYLKTLSVTLHMSGEHGRLVGIAVQPSGFFMTSFHNVSDQRL